MTATHTTHTTETHEWTLPNEGLIRDIGEAGTAAQQHAHTLNADPATIYYRLDGTLLTIGFTVETHFKDGEPA